MSETKFKMGDIVRRKQDHTIFAGWVGEVVKVDGDEISVKYKRHTWSNRSKAKNYELVERKSEYFCFQSKMDPTPDATPQEPPQTKFKVGDWVRVRKPKDDPTWIDCMMDPYDGSFCLVREECQGRLLLHHCGEWKFKPEWLEPASAVNECLTTDNVNHPPHYNQGGIECLEAIKAAVGDGFTAYLRGNVIKYLWRCEHKGGVEDLRKAAFYLDRAIKEMEVTSE